MLSIIELVFINKIRNTKDAKNKAFLIETRDEIIEKIIESRLSREFLIELIEMYDNEELNSIYKLIQKEINKRVVSELNNERSLIR